MNFVLVALALTLPPAAAPPALKVQLTRQDGGRVVALPLEEYVAAVLAGEAGVFHSPEALKAQAVAARTYALRLRGRHAAEGFDLCATTHCQRVDLRTVTSRLKAAAGETGGELLWYEGKLAYASYSGDCGGKTEDARAVWPELSAPYLTSHGDPYCTRSGVAAWRWPGGGREIIDALLRSGLRAPRMLQRIAIASRTASGRVRTLSLAGGGEQVPISAGSFRLAIGRALGWDTLRNDRYEVAVRDERFLFEGSGAGHGVGLCQRGAEQMGADGRTYREILAFYYPGTEAGLNARGVKWLRFGDESVVVLAAHAEAGQSVLRTAGKLSREVAARTGLGFIASPEVRVYPDLDTFRNATGEPGWVAARTNGTRIELQPAAELRKRGVLESTLRHELAHVLIEQHARPGLPLWFREGLAEYMVHPDAMGATPSTPGDADIRQRDDAARARRAYAEAARKVAALVHRFGEATVLSWLDQGLPPQAR